MIKLYVSTVALFIAAIVVITIPIDPTLTANTRFGIATFLIVSGVFFLIWPSMRKQDLDAIETLPGTLEEIRKLGREYYRNTSAIQENSAFVKELSDEILSFKKPLDELLIERRQQLMSVKSDLTEWQKTIIRHFEYLYRSINLEGIDEVRQQTYQKVAIDYMRELRPLGLEIIQPKVGEQFDEHFHECKQEIESTDFAPGQIISIDGIGFCLLGRCIKAVPVCICRHPVESEEQMASTNDPTQSTEKAEVAKVDMELPQ